MQRIPEQLLRRALFKQISEIHHADAVGDIPDDADIVRDEHTAATRKLEPVMIPMKVTAPVAQAVPAAGTAGALNSPPASGTRIDDSAQTYNAGETNYLADIMQNVRKIAAAVAVPVMLASAPNVRVMDIPTPNISDAYNVENIRETNNTFTTDTSRTYNNSGRTYQIGKVCDEVVIHVANTDQKGRDEIRAEVIRVFEELGEG